MVDNPNGYTVRRMSDRRDKSVLLIALIADRVGLALLYIVFGPVVRQLGIDELQFGLLIAAANITLGLASPWWGRRSQAIGRKPVLIAGLTGYAAGFVALGLALQAGLDGRLAPGALFAWLLAARLLYGLFAAGTQPAATAYIADITAPGLRARGMALIGVAAGVGTLIGPALGGLLTGVATVAPLYAAAGIAAGAALLCAVALRESHGAALRKTASRGRLAWTDRRILRCLAGWCVVVLVMTGLQTVIAFYIADDVLGPDATAVTRATSLAFLAMGAAMIVTQVGVLQATHIAPGYLTAVGFALFGAAAALLAVAGSMGLVYVGFALMGAGFGAIGPGLNAAGTLAVHAHERGAVAGLLAAAPVIGMIVGPLAGATLYGVHHSLPFAAGCAASLAMAAWFVSGQRRDR